MNFITKLKLGWKRLSTAEKIGTVIDILCSVGSTSMGIIVGNKMSKDRGILEGICIRTTAAGLGLAGGEIASKALRENYGNLAAQLIDKAKEKSAAQKEESEDE